MNAPSMFDVARLVGDALREVKTPRRPLPACRTTSTARRNFIVGGQIRGEPPRLFHVYGEGNFIEATADTPYFQIGESKYGKPIIDRVVTRATTLTEATKCVLVSFDSTMRCNISVGLPIDLLVYETGALRVAHAAAHRRERTRTSGWCTTQWGEGLRRVFAELPDPNWA